MASKPLSLVSAGHQARRRETNHSGSSSSSGLAPNQSGGKKKRTNQRNRNWSAPKRGGAGANGLTAPFPAAGKYDLIMDEDEALGGRKKKGKTINHLLNFQSYTNDQTVTRDNRDKRRNRTNSHRYRGSHGKEDYVQATAQFIIDENAQLEFEPFLRNPNIHVPWKFIEGLVLYSQDEANCPICLSPPIAGQASRCGHAHCYSCVLHLISISEKPQCPICHNDIEIGDLRSVIPGTEERPKISKKLEFVKMRCSKNSITPSVFMRESNIDSSSDGQNWFDRHQRLIIMKREVLVSNILDSEDVQLVAQRAECEASEIPFIEQAQELIRQRRAALLTRQSVAKLGECVPNLLKDVKQRSPVSTGNDLFEGSNPNIESPNHSETSTSPEDNNTAKVELAEVDTNHHFFYQCSDGSPIFISSLNAKCLIEQYGSVKEAPDRIRARLVEIDEFTMDQEIRKRFRYLNHLSDGQPFSVVLLESKDLNLNEETFKKFKDQIVSRSRRRAQKEKDENRAYKEFEAHYDRELYGKYEAADISLASLEMFPDFDESPASPEDSFSEATAPQVTPTEPLWIGKPKKDIFPTDEDFFPSLGTPKVGSTGTFWGAMTKVKSPPKSTIPPSENVLICSDEERARPSQITDIGDDIVQAIETSLNKSITQPNQRPKKGMKKKKGTKITF